MMAISYIRYSTSGQHRGDSMRRQIEASQQYCKEHGLELLDTVKDLGVSGFTGANSTKGALSRFIADVESGAIQTPVTLILESLDRLSRQEVERSLRLLLELVDLGVTVVTLQDGHVYTTGQMDMIKLMTSLLIMSRAHEESVTKSKRLAAAWGKKKEAARSGKILTKNVPGWLSVVGDTFVVDEVKAERVRKAFALMASGLGHYATCSSLNRDGILSHGDRPWTPTGLRKLTEGQSVIGIYQPHNGTGTKRVPVGDPIENYYPPIVDRAVYEKVQDNLKANGGRNVQRNRKVANLFTGMVTCKCCGSVIRYASKGKRYEGRKPDNYFACRGRTEGNGCDLPYQPYHEVENVVLFYLAKYAPLSLAQTTVKPSDLAEVRQQLTNITEAIAIAGMTTEFAKKLQELQAKEAELSEAIAGTLQGEGWKDELKSLQRDTEGRLKTHNLLKAAGLKMVIGDRYLELSLGDWSMSAKWDGKAWEDSYGMLMRIA